MSRPVNPIICDGCGKTKGQSNAWWTAKTYQNAAAGFFVAPGTIAEMPRDYMQGVAPFDEPSALIDLCGQECVLRFVSEQMGRQANG